MAKQNYCVDCETEIDRRASRCNSCELRRRWTKRNYRQKMSAALQLAHQRGAYGEPKKKHCIDCGTKIYLYATRCCSCAAKNRWQQKIYDKPTTRRKMSETSKQAWQSGAYDDRVIAYSDEEHCRKISEGVKAAWEQGLYDKQRGQKISEKLKIAHRRGDFDNIFKSPSSLEIAATDVLDVLKIEYIPQYRPDGHGCIYDIFVIPNTLIEIQGDYFHSEKHFPGIRKRDAEKKQWAIENGFDFIEIWEHEIHELGTLAILQERLGCCTK